ncbi:MAG: tyrosine-type recombinase/integrase, partial [Silvibacterium sp.]
KRSSGVQFIHGIRVLTLFCGRVGDVPLERITARRVLAFLNAPSKSTRAWRVEYSLLNYFFEYWNLRGQMPFLLLPSPRPREKRTFVPFIYTRFQIRSLLNATKICQKRLCSVDARTFRMFLLILYATGARFSEVLNLRFEDIALRRSHITFRGTNAKRDRRIPIGSDLRQELESFLKSFPRKNQQGGQIFLAKSGQMIPTTTLMGSFQRLRRMAGVVRDDGQVRQPRMHDLRSTFAVHQITSWIKSGLDLNRMLPALATYMGNVCLESAYRYLSMTPERYRKELEKLSPQRGRRRWRDDANLMRFLDNL